MLYAKPIAGKLGCCNGFRLTKNIQERAKIEKFSSGMKGGSMLLVADMLK